MDEPPPADGAPHETWTVHVRRARAEDAAAIGALTAAAYDADGHLDGEPGYGDVLRDAADRERLAELLVAVTPDGTLLGTVTFCRPGTPYAEVARPEEAEFRMLAVDPGARGQGVANLLVRACLDRAREAGYAGMALSTLERMVGARRLYERLGFVRAPDRDWSVPGVPLLVYTLRWDDTVSTTGPAAVRRSGGTSP